MVYGATDHDNAIVADGVTYEPSSGLKSATFESSSGLAPGNGSLMTPRESETLRLIAEGLSAPAIGDALHLSTATVKTHLQHIYAKLGVSERAAAVAEAMRRGLLE